jgi:hypothetical protein
MGCVAGVPFFEPPNGKGCRVEIDLIPAEVHQLGCPEVVAIADKDSCLIPLAMAVTTSRLYQAVNLALG